MGAGQVQAVGEGDGFNARLAAGEPVFDRDLVAAGNGRVRHLDEQVRVLPAHAQVPLGDARAEGQRLTLLLDDVPLLTVSDGAFAEGTPGLLLASKGPLSLPADDFSATVE